MGNQNENKYENLYQKYRKSMIQIGSSTYKLEIKDNNAIYAIKEINERSFEEDLEEFQKYQEKISILSKINNENIIKYYDFFKEKDTYIVVMEYGGDTNLKQFIEKREPELIEPKLLEDIIIQICNGIKELHNNNIVLGCLNPYDIFINNNLKVKISLPLSLLELYYQKTCVRSEIHYFSPEIRECVHFKHLTPKTDLWSLGCIIYELFTLNDYYEDKILRKDCKINTDIYNPKWQELIDLLLKRDYSLRPNIEETLKIIQSINLKDEINLDNEKGKKYKNIRKIGEGGFGDVYLVEKDNNYYALKKLKFKLTKEELEQYQKILNILLKIKNENIIKYYEFFLENDYLNIVMEYCGDTDLKQFIKNQKAKNELIEEELIKDFIIQICNGLKEIHNNGIIHRDLTPDNIFIGKNNKIKIGDFSISKILTKSTLLSVKQSGKYRYFAPEFELEGKFNYKTDIYSLGCIIYELITLNEYYIDKKINEKDCKIDSDNYNKKWQEVIELLLNKNYKLRPDIEEVLNSIKKIQKNIKNEIKLNLKVENIDINNEVNFLTHFETIDNFKPLNELSELNTEIFINEKQLKFQRSFNPEKEGIYSVIIKFHNPLKDCSYMFYGCDNIIGIDLSSFDTKNIINMKNMFMFCINLKSIDLSNFNTTNVENMENMFYRCKNLIKLNLTSFDIKNVKNISGFIDGCNSLKEINVKKNTFTDLKDDRLKFV